MSFIGNDLNILNFERPTAERKPCRLATTDTLTSLTALVGNEAEFDGLTLSNGDRVLVRAQTDAEENGIYEAVVQADGTFDLIRAPDANTSDLAGPGTTVRVNYGNTQAGKVYYTETIEAFVLGTNDITWTEQSGGLDRELISVTAPAPIGTLNSRALIVEQSASDNSNNISADFMLKGHQTLAENPNPRAGFTIISGDDQLLYFAGAKYCGYKNENGYYFVDLDSNFTKIPFYIEATTGFPRFQTNPIFICGTVTNANDTGIAGQMKFDGDYIYICCATNTWVRAALTSWGGM